jgi:hypothetical protein
MLEFVKCLSFEVSENDDRSVSGSTIFRAVIWGYDRDTELYWLESIYDVYGDDVEKSMIDLNKLVNDNESDIVAIYNAGSTPLYLDACDAFEAARAVVRCILEENVDDLKSFLCEGDLIRVE